MDIVQTAGKYKTYILNICGFASAQLMWVSDIAFLFVFLVMVYDIAWMVNKIQLGEW